MECLFNISKSSWSEKTLDVHVRDCEKIFLKTYLLFIQNISPFLISLIPQLILPNQLPLTKFEGKKKKLLTLISCLLD